MDIQIGSQHSSSEMFLIRPIFWAARFMLALSNNSSTSQQQLSWVLSSVSENSSCDSQRAPPWEQQLKQVFSPG